MRRYRSNNMGKHHMLQLVDLYKNGEWAWPPLKTTKH